MNKQLILKRVAATGAVATILAPLATFGATIDFGLNDIGNNIGLSSNTNVNVVAANIIRVILGFLGLIAVVIVLYAGFQWMTAAGNEEKITSAPGAPTAGVIGLVIILAAYAITAFVITTIIEQVTN